MLGGFFRLKREKTTKRKDFGSYRFIIWEGHGFQKKYEVEAVENTGIDEALRRSQMGDRFTKDGIMVYNHP